MENYIDLAEKVIQRLLYAGNDPETNDHFSMEKWEWPQGVALYSLYLYYKKTGKTKYLDFIIDWFERKIKEGLPEKNVNTVAPLLALIHLYEIKPDQRYLDICKKWAEWIVNEMPEPMNGDYSTKLQTLLMTVRYGRTHCS